MGLVDTGRCDGSCWTLGGVMRVVWQLGVVIRVVGHWEV